MTNRLTRVIALGCIVCGNAAVPHHPRGAAFETGMGLKADDAMVLPLCNTHHTTGGRGMAFHSGQEIWEKNFGTQEALLIEVHTALGESVPQWLIDASAKT